MPFSRSQLSQQAFSPSSRPLLGVLAVCAVVFSGCLPALPHIPPGEAPAFDAIAFFDGRSHGAGTLAIRGRASQPVRVESVGTVGADGGIVLVQLVRLGDAPAEERTWRLRPDGPARWTGTLTDASGPVEAQARGNRLRIRYPMGRGLVMAQELTLQPGGQAALNQATVRFLGVPIARLSEWIQRAPPEHIRPSLAGSGEPPR